MSSSHSSQSSFLHPSSSKFIFLLLRQLFLITKVSSQQINLGSLSLRQNPSTGDLQFGLGQGADILGFGGDRQLGLNLGPGRFGARTDNGLLLGGHRFGLDSQVGYEQGRGIDFGSFLNLFQPFGRFLSQFSRPPAPTPAQPAFSGSAPRPAAEWHSFAEEHVQPPPAFPPPSSANGGRQEGEGFVPNWKSWDEDEDESGKGTTEVDPFELPLARGSESELPWSIGIGRQSIGSRVTTEGKLHGGEGMKPRTEEGNLERKNDGNTGRNESEKPRKGLPILNGLEPLSNH